MDKWNCSHCGEELLGAVNRCWKCGQRVSPPPPQPVEEPLLADVADTTTTVAVAAERTVVPLTVEEVALAFAKDPPRRGSPFAFEALPAERQPYETFYGEGPYRRDTQSGSRYVPPRKARYPRFTSAVGGTAAAFILGLMSLIILRFSLLGGFTAALGVGCAVWGLMSPKRRELALFALILCCLVLTLAAWMLGFSVYRTFFQAVGANAAGTGF